MQDYKMRLLNNNSNFFLLILVLSILYAYPQAPPTISPTLSPTRSPTLSPTFSPSFVPTVAPTRSPTAFPTCVPTTAPTTAPTFRPSFAPTCSPSFAPTPSPTRAPTASPSFLPTPAPTSAPTNIPTASPTHPTSQPTSQPSRQPSSRPSSQPSSRPSSQPSSRPSSQPSSRPSSQPSSRPSSQPSSKPSSRPSSQPSTQPSSKPTSPTSQPSSHPTQKPSSQPSTQPSSRPTSVPTSRPSLSCLAGNYVNSTDRSNDKCLPCADGTYSEAHAYACTPCGPGSETPDRISCNQCQIGYISTNTTNVACSQCPLGKYSDPTNTQCIDCAAGTISNAPSSTCTLCPIGSFSSLTGQTNCTLCPISFYAEGLGTVNCDSCPPGLITPFLGSTVATACLSPVPNFTFGIFALVTAFFMTVYFYMSHFHNTSFMRKNRVVNLILANASQLFRAASKLKSILIASTRHTHEDHDKENQNCAIKTARVLQFLAFILMCIITICIQIPLMYLIFIARIFYTSFILWRGLQFDLSLNLPPFGEILDSILAAILTVVKIPYFEYLLYIFYPIKYVLIGLAYIKLDLSAVRVTCDGSQAPIKMCFNIAIIGTIIVLVESSYSLTFLVTMKKLYQHCFSVFFFAPGFRAWSKLGICDFYTFAAYLTIFAFICSCVPFQGILQFLMTFVQIQAFIGGHARNASCDRVEGLYGLDSTLAYWTTIVFYAMIVPAVYSIGRILVPGLPSGRVFRFLGRNGYFIDKGLYSNYTITAYDIHEEEDKIVSETSVSIAYKYVNAVKARTNIIFSPDVWFLSTIGLLNLRFLKYKIEKILNLHYADDDILDNEFPADGTLQIMDACNMNLKDSEAEQLKLAQSSDFPTYMVLSSFVLQEFQEVVGVKNAVRERIYFGQPNKVINFVLLLLAYSGIGHLFTKVGRTSWMLLFWKYFIFFTVSLGIWTEEAVDAFTPELQHARLTLYYHKDIGDSLYAILGLRSVLFQIVPILTILSIFVQNTARTPLFVFSRKLSSRLPSLFMSFTNAKLIALESELDRIKDLRIDAATDEDIMETQEWLISFRALSIIGTTSRIVMFNINIFVVIMSVGVCYSLKNMTLWILASIVILAPIAVLACIETVTSIGTMMHITDVHFNDFNFHFTSKNLLSLVGHYDKKTAKKHDDLGIDIDYYGLFNHKNYREGEPDEFAELDDPLERPSRTIESMWLSGPIQCEDPPEKPSRATNHGNLFQRNPNDTADTNTEPNTNSDSGSHDGIDTNPSYIDNPGALAAENPDVLRRGIEKTSSSKKIMDGILKIFSSGKSNVSSAEDSSITDDHIKTVNTQDEDEDKAAAFSMKNNANLDTLMSKKHDGSVTTETAKTVIDVNSVAAVDGNSITQLDRQFFRAFDEDSDSSFKFHDDEEDAQQNAQQNEDWKPEKSKGWFS